MEAHTEGITLPGMDLVTGAATTGEERGGCVGDVDRGLSPVQKAQRESRWRPGVPVWRLASPGIPQTSFLRPPVGIQEEYSDLKS